MMDHGGVLRAQARRAERTMPNCAPRNQVTVA